MSKKIEGTQRLLDSQSPYEFCRCLHRAIVAYHQHREVTIPFLVVDSRLHDNSNAKCPIEKGDVVNRSVLFAGLGVAA